MPMLKEFIQKEHPFQKLKSNESGKCPILPDFAHIFSKKCSSFDKEFLTNQKEKKK